MDAVPRPEATRTQRTADRDHVSPRDPTSGSRKTLETALQQPTRRKYGTALVRSQSVDGPTGQPFTPRLSSRSSLADWSPLQSSPSRLGRTSWSLVNTPIINGSETALSLPGSPLSRSRPVSASLVRESGNRVPRAHSYAGDTIVHERDQEDDYPHRSRTPATLRPASAALQPITEGTPLDQDTSLADTSTFFYDRFRFSSFSTRSDFVATSPRSSPMPALRTDSIASSRNTDVSSTTGSPSAFKPRQLMITRPSSVNGPEFHSHLSGSDSGRLLRSASAQFVQVARHGTERRDSREAVRIRSSEIVRSTPVQSIDQARSSPGQAIDGRPEQTGPVAEDDVRNADGSDPRAETGKSAGIPVEISSVQDKTGNNPRDQRCVPSQILISQPSIPCMLPIDDHDGSSKSKSTPSSPEVNKVNFTLSPSGDDGSATVLRARSSSSPSEGDYSLPSSSLSAPRSAASADSRSSEAVEVVPWQVATTDSDGVRKSEEIFRPLSLIQSRRGSSNTVIPGILPSAADSTGSRASTIRKMPPTPLKGVSGTEWASRSSHEDVNMDSEMFSQRIDEGIGLGISHFPLRTVQQEPSAKTSVAAQSQRRSLQSRDLGQDHAELQTKVKRHPSQMGRLPSPSGAMHRLLSELEPVTTDSQLRRKAVARPKLGYGTRSSSLRRYHPHGGHVSLELPRWTEKDAVLFDHHDTDRRLPARCSRQVDSACRNAVPPFDVTFAGAIGQTGLVAASHDVSHRYADTNEVQRIPRFLGLTISLGMFMMIYKSLFFTFEAPYWWNTISPALPLAAAALFLLSDGLIIQLLLQRQSSRHLVLCSLGVSVLSLLYCVVLSVWITIRLIRSSDKGASAPGIHFDRSRDTVAGGSAAQEVLRDMPMPVVLAGVGIIGAVVDAGLAMWLWWRLPSSRRGDVEGR